MKVAVLGSGDITKIHRFSHTSEKELKKLIQDVGKLLAEKKVELIMVPARGIPYEVAKIYKANKGPKVIGAIPKDDKEYGLMHIKEYLHIMDEEINIGDWYDLNGRIASLSDVAICIGLSSGAMADIVMLKYHYKYFNSKTKLVIFKNTISAPIQKEIEEEIPITYITSIKELGRLL